MTPGSNEAMSARMGPDKGSPPTRAIVDGQLDSLLGVHGALPSEADWDPVEEALYTPNPFRMGERETATLRYTAIRSSFAHHLRHNAFYRRYCEAAGVTAENLQGPEDLDKIPLVPEHIFRGCPGPEDFVGWMASFSSDELVWPTSRFLPGSYAEQGATLWRDYGIRVCSTLGVRGQPSFLPMDRQTGRRAAHWKVLTLAAMFPGGIARSDLVSVSLWPQDCEWTDLFVPHARVQLLFDRQVGLEKLLPVLVPSPTRGFFERLWRRGKTTEGTALLQGITSQLKELANTGVSGVLWSPPDMLYAVGRFLQDRRVGLALGTRWRIICGGGWQFLRQPPLATGALRTFASQTLGIPLEHVHDLYSVAACLGLGGLSCEGGYQHIPHAVLQPLVLNAGMEPVDEGEWGRFAFLNPLIRSYPGFILTEDWVRLWRRCPACDRTGPVLDAEIGPEPDGETRQCGSIVRQIIEERLTT